MRAQVLIALACLVHTARADPAADLKALQAEVARLEARLKTVEETNARYAEALAFLQKVYDQQKAQETEHDRGELAPDGIWAVDIAQDLKAGQVEGGASAGVTIVMAFDFADPYSNRALPVLWELMKTYSGKLRIVYKHMIVHPQIATQAHLAGCAAASQHKFVDFMHAFWPAAYTPYTESRDATKLDTDAMVALASQLHLDVARFKADMASPGCAGAIKADQVELERFKVNATPTFFINGTVVNGAVQRDQYTTVIDAKLKLVEASKLGGKYYDAEIMKHGERAFRSKLDKKP